MDPHGIVKKRRFPLPSSLANFKRDFSEEKMDGGPGLGQQEARQNQQQEYEPTSASPPVSTSSRRGTASPASTSTGPHAVQTPPAGGGGIRSRLASTFQELPEVEMPANDSLGDRPGETQEAPGPDSGEEPYQDRGSCPSMSGVARVRRRS